MSGQTAYARAGVDVAAGERAVDLLRARLRTAETDLLGGIGAFGAALAIPAGYEEPVIVTATDGAGTKTDLARRLGRLETIGQDLVAMCVDDIVCHGAQPAYFLDYVAVGRIDPESVATIVGGIARACEAVGCALVGGETAEHPGVMAADAFDLAGFTIGFVERRRLIDGSAVRAGDVVIGLASSGLHANGYSLVRRLIDESSLDLDGSLADGSRLADVLMAPTRLYAPVVLRLLEALATEGRRIGGLAHVTGGGLAANLPRALPRPLGVRVDVSAWPVPPVFGALATMAGIDWPEMRATFNCGIGFAVVAEREVVDRALSILGDAGIAAWPMGDVRPIDELGGARYVEA